VCPHQAARGASRGKIFAVLIVVVMSGVNIAGSRFVARAQTVDLRHRGRMGLGKMRPRPNDDPPRNPASIGSHSLAHALAKEGDT
jgi:hypothetical protein